MTKAAITVKPAFMDESSYVIAMKTEEKKVYKKEGCKHNP